MTRPLFSALLLTGCFEKSQEGVPVVQMEEVQLPPGTKLLSHQVAGHMPSDDNKQSFGEIYSKCNIETSGRII